MKRVMKGGEVAKLKYRAYYSILHVDTNKEKEAFG
jgi:hypothetical protein